MIKLKNVSRLYPAKAEANGGVIRALDDFCLNVDPGEWIASRPQAWNDFGSLELERRGGRAA